MGKTSSGRTRSSPASRPRDALSRSGRRAPSDTATPRRSSSTGMWAVCLLAAAGVIAYANSLRNPFIFDDLDAIQRNPFITSLWPLWGAMRAPAQGALAGRPIASLSLAVSFASGGLSPVAFRLWNLGVLIASSMVLFGIVRRTLGRLGDHAGALFIATSCALLWMLHPLQTEVVNYVTQRTESMMGLFYLLTLYTAMRSMEHQQPSPGWTTASIVACAMGMACKESMATAPVMVLLYDGVFGPGTGMFFTFGLVAWIGLDFLTATGTTKMLNATTNVAAFDNS